MEGSRLSLLVLMVWASGVRAQITPHGLGENLTVQCEYAEMYTDERKTWCKQTNPNNCNLIVTTRTTSASATSASDRTRITDNKQTRVISVTVENLIVEDTGVYWCGIYIYNEVIIVKKINLQVSSGLLPEVIARAPGDTVTVRCDYPEGYEDYWKTWCRETIRETCNPILSTRTTSSNPATASSGRITIMDDKKTRVISVRIEKLTEEDAGVYWCGVQLTGRIKIEKRFELQISNDFRTPNVTSVAGNCTTTYTRQTRLAPSCRSCCSSVCWSDWKLVTLVIVVLLNKVLAAGGIYAIIRRQNRAAV